MWGPNFRFRFFLFHQAAIDQGAPPEVLGTEMLFCVFNDLGSHQNLFNTQPLGIEVQQREVEELPEYELQVSDIDFEDYGFLDLIEIGTDNFNASGETAAQITALMEEFADKITSGTAAPITTSTNQKSIV